MEWPTISHAVPFVNLRVVVAAYTTLFSPSRATDVMRRRQRGDKCECCTILIPFVDAEPWPDETHAPRDDGSGAHIPRIHRFPFFNLPWTRDAARAHKVLELQQDFRPTLARLSHLT